MKFSMVMAVILISGQKEPTLSIILLQINYLVDLMDTVTLFTNH